MATAPDAPGAGDVTRCLTRLGAGDAHAAGDLLELLYAHLRQLAAATMRGERSSHTLDPTALVHEAWLRLFGYDARHFADRAHFLRAAARAMRRVLIDHARSRGRQKRTADPAALPLAAWLDGIAARQLDLLALDEALDRLEAVDADLAHLVELRFFSGLSIAEAAAVLGRSTASVERDWRCARALLRRLLDEELA
jgi:RNA polymerase sigma-70 factor (ECF subfamily)